MGKANLESRLWAKIDTSGKCWLWTGAKSSAGYGQFAITRRLVPAHRVVYEMAIGPIPRGLTIDHLCGTPLCVNPEHLEAVSMRENILRGNGACAENARKTHCKHGHLFDSANTYLRVSSNGHPYRACRTCLQQFVEEKRSRQPKTDGL